MISKLMLIEQVTIQEKKQQLINKGISQDIIDNLLQQDPTNKNKNDNDKVGSYTDWICNTYITTKTLPNIDQLRMSLILYSKYKHKILDNNKKNITNFATFEDFISFIESQPFAKTQEIIEQKEYDTIYSNKFIIYIPYTQKQATELGKGTKWCTTSDHGGQFDQYLCTGILFYIFDKSSNSKKYNLFLSLDSDYFDYDFYENNLQDPENPDDDPLQDAKTLEFADQSDNTSFDTIYEFAMKYDQSLLPTIKKYLIYTNQFDKMNNGIKKLLNAKSNEEVGIQYQQIDSEQLSKIRKENLTPNIILQSLSKYGEKIYILYKRGIKITEEYAQVQSKSSNEQLRYLFFINYPITNKIINSQLDKKIGYQVFDALSILISNGIDVGENLTKQTIERNPNLIHDTMHRNLSVPDTFKKQQIQLGSDPKIFNYEIININKGKIQVIKSIESLLKFNNTYSYFQDRSEYYKSVFESSKCFISSIKIPESVPIILEIYLKYKNQSSNIYKNPHTQILENDFKLTRTYIDNIYDLISKFPDIGFDLLSKLKSYLTSTQEISKFHKETIQFLSQKTIDEVNKYYPKVCLESLSKIRTYNENLIENQIKTDVMQLQYLLTNKVLKNKIPEKYYILSAQMYDDWAEIYTKQSYKLPKNSVIQQIKRNPESVKYFIDNGFYDLDDIIQWLEEDNTNDQQKILSDQYSGIQRIMNNVDKYV